MTVRPMTVTDLQSVLEWAADEGWNPGLDDASAFHAADPDGFFLKYVDDRPVAAISVVNHDAETAFLGLYLCRPDFRGQGYGMEVWRAGLVHAGNRRIGLDGVPDQQANYERSGFAKHGRTIRFEGVMPQEPDPRVQKVEARDLKLLIAADKKATGLDRSAFTNAWFAGSATRRTLKLRKGADVVGFATFRKCGTGVKVGPLHAESCEDALMLLSARPPDFGPGPIFVDASDHSSSFAAALKQIGFSPVFETARMFTGTPPESQPPPIYAIATMELG